MYLALTTKNYVSDDQSWLGSAHGTQATQTITLQTSLFTAATHYPDGFFKSGIPLGRVDATGLYGPWDSAATDGRQNLAGHLYSGQDAPPVTSINVVAPILEHGRVRVGRLPVPFTAAQLTAARASVAGRIIYAN